MWYAIVLGGGLGARMHAGRNKVVLTLGGDGAVYQAKDGLRTFRSANKVNAVDTTAAGDTFTGFFLSEILCHGDAVKALEIATTAAGIAVSRKGAEPSIPMMREVIQ